MQHLQLHMAFAQNEKTLLVFAYRLIGSFANMSLLDVTHA